MSIDVEALKGAFEILGFGWAGVFLVLFILYLSSMALLKGLPVKKE